eukprot:gnl/TRDRNA2_/TRDRNA2_145723_c0_seq1.p1 gnl/TRDRNA2_/TRDRNA2_145723_c0~~gnl/TRDRNA2_/TRDRNA2_145723_c0_seq1.p1  ORF type:complete len:429 (+),score=94.10 gnl/TRDRNA2_/TRDRNA2_145723_c0_seq1:134-1420(+)
MLEKKLQRALSEVHEKCDTIEERNQRGLSEVQENCLQQIAEQAAHFRATHSQHVASLAEHRDVDRDRLQSLSTESESMSAKVEHVNKDIKELWLALEAVRTAVRDAANTAQELKSVNGHDDLGVRVTQAEILICGHAEMLRELTADVSAAKQLEGRVQAALDPERLATKVVIESQQEAVQAAFHAASADDREAVTAAFEEHHKLVQTYITSVKSSLEADDQAIVQNFQQFQKSIAADLQAVEKGHQEKTIEMSACMDEMFQRHIVATRAAIEQQQAKMTEQVESVMKEFRQNMKEFRQITLVETNKAVQRISESIELSSSSESASKPISVSDSTLKMQSRKKFVDLTMKGSTGESNRSPRGTSQKDGPSGASSDAGGPELSGNTSVASSAISRSRTLTAGRNRGTELQREQWAGTPRSSFRRWGGGGA